MRSWVPRAGAQQGFLITHAGLLVLVSGGLLTVLGGTDGQMLMIDVGPLGGSQTAGHGHADLLSVQCAAFGEPFLIDARTYGYTGDSHARSFFRARR